MSQSPNSILSVSYEKILDHLNEGVYFVDCDRRITYWNQAAERLTGYRASEVIGTRCADNVLCHVDQTGRCLCTNGCPLQASIEQGQSGSVEVFMHHRNGQRVPVTVYGQPVTDSQGKIIGAVETFFDRSADLHLKEEYEQLKKQAYLDPLTEIPNRRYVEEQLRSAHNQAERMAWDVGALFIDLDQFKRINDLYGHHAGDQILIMAAQTLRKNIRPYDTVGRWGGEEFFVVLPNIDWETLLEIAERLRIMVQTAFVSTAAGPLKVTASIGATLSRSGESIEDLVGRADDKVYDSKARGRNCVTSDWSCQAIAV